MNIRIENSIVSQHQNWCQDNLTICVCALTVAAAQFNVSLINTQHTNNNFKKKYIQTAITVCFAGERQCEHRANRSAKFAANNLPWTLTELCGKGLSCGAILGGLYWINCMWNATLIEYDVGGIR